MGGPSLLKTPGFLYRLLPNTRIMAGFGAPPVARRPTNNDDDAVPRPRGWGTGQRLGD